MVMIGVSVIGCAIAVYLFTSGKGGARYGKIRKTFFLPRKPAIAAALVVLWLLVNSCATAFQILKEPQLATEELATLTMWGVNSLLIIFFAFSATVIRDTSFAVVATMLSFACSFFSAAMISSANMIAGYFAIFNIVLGLYWGVGVGKAWFRSEMNEALKEIEGWGAPKGSSAAIKSFTAGVAGSAGHRKRPKKPPGVTGGSN
jgi:tryptophan-rich sensory protein